MHTHLLKVVLFHKRETFQGAHLTVERFENAQICYVQKCELCN